MTNALLNKLTEKMGDGFLPTTLQSVMDLENGDFDASPPAIDVNRAEGITSHISSLDLSSLSRSVASVQSSCLGEMNHLPGMDTILKPIRGVMQIAGQIEAADVSGVLNRLQQAGENSNPAKTQGLAGLEGSIRAVLDIEGETGLSNLLSLGSALTQINLTTEVDNVVNKLDGVTLVLKILGSLMSLHTSFEKTHEISSTVNGLLIPHEIEARRLNLIGWKSNTALAEQIRLVDTNDTLGVERLSKQVHEFLNDVNLFAGSLQKGLGFGDAALDAAGLDTLEQTLESLSTTLNVPVDPALALSTALRDWLAEKLPADFGAPAGSLDDIVSELQGLADDLADQINALSVDRMIEPVTGTVGRVTGVVNELNNALAAATGAIRSAFEQVRQVIDSLNLASIAETIKATLRPVVQVIDQLESFISEITETIEEAMGLAVAAVKKVKESILNGAGEVADVFEQVESVLAALDMEELINTMKSGIQAVADALKKADLDPYFDTAVDAMDTVSAIVDAVPVELLPDDMEADLQAAVQPVKAIDFDRDVREVLIEKLDQILSKVDDEILGDIDRMSKEIVAFLQKHDPSEKLEELEKEYFDPLLAAINSVDPDTMLKPVTDVINDIKGRIEEIDIRAMVVDQIDGVFDQIIAYYDQCDPEPLLAPIVDEVDAFRQQIIDLTGIDNWVDNIDELQHQVDRWLDQFDFAQHINELDAVYNAMLRTLSNDAGNTTVMGIFIAGLMSGSVALRSSSYSTVLQWVSGAEDGVETVHNFIEKSLGNLRETFGVIDSLQPDLVVAEVMPCYRRIREAVESLPADHPLRLAVEPVVVSGSPADLLAGVSANLPAYRTKVENGIQSLQRLESSGFSQITAAGQALQNAFAPLIEVKWKIIVLSRRFGIDPVGKPLMMVLGEVLAVLRPGTALEPFTVVVQALKTKIKGLTTELVVPVKQGVGEVRILLETIDIRLLSDELKAVHTQLRDDFMAFQPSTLLAEPLDEFDELKNTIQDFDPLAAVREAIEEFKQEADELLGEDSLLRPSVMFAGLLEQYQRILNLAAKLNVKDALQPVLDELAAIKKQLDEGLSETGDAFSRLQGALP